MNILNIGLGIIGLIISLLLSYILGVFIIPFFKKKEMKQFIREEGPASHFIKQGTPTGGGIIFIISIILISFLITYFFFNDFINNYLFLISSLILFSFIGFIDDFGKIFKKNNLGLTVKKKLILQILFSLILVCFFNNYFFHSGNHLFGIFIGNKIIYSILLIILYVGFSNSSNLTDGLDGLLSIISIISFATLAIISFLMKNYYIYTFCMIVIGAISGFLIFNKYPAKIFMGDIGSLGIGPLFISICYLLSLDFYIISLGIVYIIESLSVMLQVGYFKYTKLRFGEGKRLFLMSPYHHHLEVKYKNEVLCTTILSIIAIIFSFITLIYLLFSGEIV